MGGTVVRIEERLAIPSTLNGPEVILSSAVTNRLTASDARRLAGELDASADLVDPPAHTLAELIEDELAFAMAASSDGTTYITDRTPAELAAAVLRRLDVEGVRR